MTLKSISVILGHPQKGGFNHAIAADVVNVTAAGFRRP